MDRGGVQEEFRNHTFGPDAKVSGGDIHLVRANLAGALKRQKLYDEKVKEQPLEVGDEVIVLPTKQNKLQLQWVGPYKITK